MQSFEYLSFLPLLYTLQSYKQHKFEPDTERVKEIIAKSLDDAKWILNKVVFILKILFIIWITVMSNKNLYNFFIFISVHKEIMDVMKIDINGLRRKDNFIHDTRIL